MKHTDFNNLINELKNSEYMELYNAVKAHDGKYEWTDEENRPQVVMIDRNGGEAISIMVCRVFIGRHDIVNVEGVDIEDSQQSVSFFPTDLLVGHTSFIIDEIPPTELVDDVTKSTKFFPITCICREDLVPFGYDPKTISDETMKNLANEMDDAYFTSTYFDELEKAAEKVIKNSNNT